VKLGLRAGAGRRNRFQGGDAAPSHDVRGIKRGTASNRKEERGSFKKFQTEYQKMGGRKGKKRWGGSKKKKKNLREIGAGLTKKRKSMKEGNFTEEILGQTFLK